MRFLILRKEVYIEERNIKWPQNVTAYILPSSNMFMRTMTSDATSANFSDSDNTRLIKSDFIRVQNIYFG